MEQALSQASRILPLVTTTHLPSASNNSYWPETDTNMPIVEGSEAEPYSDTPAPKRFGTVSPLDPELFSSIEQHAGALLNNEAMGKYSPIEVAQWLENLSETANQSLRDRPGHASSQATPELRRFEEDIRIQIGLGEFFAAKLRSGVLYDIYKRTGDGQRCKRPSLPIAKHARHGRPWRNARQLCIAPTSLLAGSRSSVDIGWTDCPLSTKIWPRWKLYLQMARRGRVTAERK